MNIILEYVFLIIALISTIAAFAFFIKALFGFAKKDALKGKKQFKKAGISFAIMIVMFIGFAITMDPVETTDEGDKEKVETAKVEKQDPAEKSDAKAEKSAKEKKAEEKEKAAPQTPDKRITTFINKELGKETNNDKKRIVSVESGDNLSILLNADSNLTTKLTRTSMLMDATDIFQELQGYDDITGDVTVAFMLDLVDQYGNTEAGRVMSIRLTQETLKKINFESFNHDNFPNIADSYLEHRAISVKK